MQNGADTRTLAYYASFVSGLFPRPGKPEHEYVAKKLSGLQETFGKETSHGDRPLFLR